MRAYRFALYDAFSAIPFGGSQAAIVTDAAALSTDLRTRIAREIGMPATAFVEEIGADWVAVQFMSTVMELPMCGHGTICLLTHLLESGLIEVGEGPREFQLHLRETRATVTVDWRSDGRYRVMLDIRPPEFITAPDDIGALLGSLGLEHSALTPALSPEIARGDFIHLVLPLRDLDAVQSIEPDFNGIIGFCHQHGIETVAAFCLEVEDSAMDLHVRDFCPAVGVRESAAAGTTNAALTSYLLRYGLLPSAQENIEVNAEQGLELGRPSSVQSRVTLDDGSISRLQVGGVATRVIEGQVYLERASDINLYAAYQDT